MINLTDGASNSPGITPLAAGQDDEAALKQRQAAAQAIKDKQAAIAHPNTDADGLEAAGTGIGGVVGGIIGGYFGGPAGAIQGAQAGAGAGGATGDMLGGKGDQSANLQGMFAPGMTFGAMAKADALKKKPGDPSQAAGSSGDAGMGATDINASGSMGA